MGCSREFDRRRMNFRKACGFPPFISLIGMSYERHEPPFSFAARNVRSLMKAALCGFSCFLDPPPSTLFVRLSPPIVANYYSIG